MGDFRFSLRHGNTVPQASDIEEYEPFVYYDSTLFKWFLGFKLPNYPTYPLSENIFKVVELTNPPTGAQLPIGGFNK